MRLPRFRSPSRVAAGSDWNARIADRCFQSRQTCQALSTAHFYLRSAQPDYVAARPDSARKDSRIHRSRALPGTARLNTVPQVLDPQTPTRAVRLSTAAWLDSGERSDFARYGAGKARPHTTPHGTTRHHSIQHVSTTLRGSLGALQQHERSTVAANCSITG